MAKGLAVISGSNAVVFKALENGVVQMGGSGSWGTTTAQVTISGSLTLSGSEGVHLHVSGSEFRLTNDSGLADQIVISGLSDSTSDFGAQPSVGTDVKRTEEYKLKGGLLWAATSSVPSGALEDKSDPNYYSQLELESGSLAPEDFLVITEDGEVRRVNKIDASVVMLNDGQTVEQQVGGLNLNLKHSASDGSIDEKDVNLTKGDLVFKDKQYRTVLSMSNMDDNESVEVLVDLDPDLRVESLSASAGLTVTGSSKLLGDLHVVSGSGASGNATIDGKLTVKGDLDVLGDVNQVTINQSNLSIEDAIILVGSGSDGTTGELGFVFGSEGASNKAFTLKDGDFFLGNTTDDALDGDLNPDNDGLGKLVLANLSASATINALDLSVADSATVDGDLVAKSNVTLGDSASDVISIQGQLSASSGMHISAGDLDLDGALDVQGSAFLQSTLEVDDAATFNSSVTADTLRVKGAAVFDSTVDMTGSLTVAQSASISGDLSVNGNVTLNDSISDQTLIMGKVIANTDMEVRGDASFQKDVDVTGSLVVKGSTTLGDTLGEDELLIKANLTASSVARFEGDITVDNNADVTLKAGSDLTLDQGDLTMTDGAALISGSLTLTGSAADPLVVQGLTHHDTASVSGHDIVVIDADGKVSQASMLSASQIAVIPDGYELTSSDAQSAINELQNHINSLSLRIGTGSNTADSTILKDGGMIFTHQDPDGQDDSNINIAVSTTQDDSGNDIVKVNIELDHELSASSLSASQYVVADRLTASNGLKVSAGGFDVTGDSQLTGDLTIVGDLLVQGTTTVENRNVTTSNMMVEDRIIVVGSGSDPSMTQVGIQLGGAHNSGRVVALGTQPLVEQNTLFLGHVDAEDHLNNAFSSSIDVTGFKLKTGELELLDSATIHYNLTVYKDAHIYEDLGVSGTGSFGGDLTVIGETVLRGELHLTGAANFDSDLDLAGSGSIHGDLTVDGDSTLLGEVGISGAVDLGSSLNVDGVVTLGNTLDVDGAVTLNSTLAVTGAVNLKSAVTLGADSGVHYQGVSGSNDWVESAGNITNSADAIADNLVKVNGPFRAPIFSTDGQIGGHPRVPLAWCTDEPQMEYEGYMFYLKGPDTNVGIEGSPFTQSNKWYFNEGGYWHSSFFWQED